MHPPSRPGDLLDLQNTQSLPRRLQGSLNFEAIRVAVVALADRGTFRTKEVANHAFVAAAHVHVIDDERFAQQIGTHLSQASGTLGIERVSSKGVANAKWQGRSSPR